METDPVENFTKIVNDMIGDLKLTFSEYSDKLDMVSELLKTDQEDVHKYAMGVIPPRFFDVLYQNEDMFTDDDIDTKFLPDLDFALFFTASDVTENTKGAIWKYLHMILFSLVGDVKNKSEFGDTADLFKGIEENDLNDKIKEAFENMGNLFDKVDDAAADEPDTESSADGQEPPRMPEGMPNLESIQEHLKFVFEGKIGSLAKELTAEMKEELTELIGDEGDVKSTKDMFKKLIRNPKKINDLVKKLTSKVEEKVKSGNVSKEELLAEAKDIMGRMNEFGGKEKFADMMKGMAKTMGGKGAKFNMGAFEKMAKQGQERERLLKKIEERKKARVVAENNKKKFTIDGEQQQKSRREVDETLLNELLEDESLSQPAVVPPKPKSKSSGKPKSKSGGKAKSKSKK
jgi:hypothetical protein